jgi:hypothetical protein
MVDVEKTDLRYLDRGLGIQRHQAVMDGRAGNPWQYRVLSEYIVEGMLRSARAIGIRHPVHNAFIAFRLAQNICIFLLAAYYYAQLGLSVAGSLLGMALLTWSFVNGFYDGGLAFNTYGDVIFYLLAGLLLLRRQFGWASIVAVLAVLNRETALLIPLLILFAGITFRPRWSLDRRAMRAALLAGFMSVTVFFGLRAYYGEQEFIAAYGHLPGLDLWAYNVSRRITWVQLLSTVNLLPVVALAAIRQWPSFLHRAFWCVVPIWLVVHIFFSAIAETRLLFVPIALVFIPAALVGAVKLRDRCASATSCEDQRDSWPSLAHSSPW